MILKLPTDPKPPSDTEVTFRLSRDNSGRITVVGDYVDKNGSHKSVNFVSIYSDGSVGRWLNGAHINEELGLKVDEYGRLLDIWKK